MKTAVDRRKSLAQYIKCYATAIPFRSNCAEFLRLLGKLCRQQGKLPQAFVHFRIAVSLDPASSDACIALSQILEQIYPRTYDPKIERALESCFASPAVEYQTLALAICKGVAWDRSRPGKRPG